MRRGAKSELDPIIRNTILDIYRTRWNDVDKYFGPNLDITKIETDLFIRRIWAESYEIAQSQLEEVFCDLLGVYVFGQSFLYSFRYLVAPSLGHTRSIYYPRPRSRAEYMQATAIAYGLDKIHDFVDTFSAQEPQLTPPDKFRVEVADAATDKLHIRLPDLVKRYAGKAEHFKDSAALVPQIGKNLSRLIPTASVNSISAIVHAAWELRLNIDTWQILEAITDESSRKAEKLRVLRDLVLKSFEVYEFNKRTEKNAA